MLLALKLFSQNSFQFLAVQLANTDIANLSLRNVCLILFINIISHRDKHEVSAFSRNNSWCSKCSLNLC